MATAKEKKNGSGGKGAKRATRRRASAQKVAQDLQKITSGGENGVTAEELQPLFDEIHQITDRMEEDNATSRGDINAVYDRTCDKLGLCKEALTFTFGEQRRRMKAERKAAKMNSRARESLQACAQALGGALGDYLAHIANVAPKKPEEGDES